MASAAGINSESLGARLDRTGGTAPGFDRVRIALAALVLLIHGERVVRGAGTSLFVSHWVMADLIVPWFFMLSGFLVTISAQKHTVPEFLINRCARVLPALSVCAVLTVFFLGPIMTTLPLEDYFGSFRTWSYLAIAVGYPRFVLPGVFENLPDAPVVNVSIWTVRWELACYLIVAALGVLGLLSRTRLIGTATALLALCPVIALLAAWAIASGPEGTPHAPELVAHFQTAFISPIELPEQGGIVAVYWLIETVAGWNFRIVPYFFAGSFAATIRNRLTISPGIALLSALGLVFCEFALPAGANGPVFYTLALIPSFYCIAWLGLHRFRPIRWLDNADYSYGVYLFGYPVQQLCHAAGLDRGSGLLNAAVALPFTFILAMASWHFVERPVLAMRGPIWRRFASVRAGLKSPPGLAD